MNDLTRLLNLHRRRLQQAERALAERGRQWKADQATAERSESSLLAHRAQEPARERAIFDGVLGRQVKCTAVERAREAVATLQRDGVVLEESLTHARNVADESRRQLDEARHGFVRQGRRAEKYQELERLANDRVIKGLLAREEAEADDLIRRRVP